MSSTSPLLSRWRECAAAHANRVAIEDAHESVTFRELDRRMQRAAARLHALGLAGQRVAVLARPECGWVETFLGVLHAGGTVVPLSPLYPTPEQTWFVEASRAAAVVVSEDLVAVGHAAAGGRPVLRSLTLKSDGPANPLPAEPRSARDAALLLYTSGTTGRPKAVPLTDTQVLAGTETLRAAWRITETDRLLHVLPLHHLHGVAVSLLTALLAGATTRLVPKFDPVRVWDELARTTVLMAVPTQHRKLFDALDAADAPRRARWTESARTLRLVTSGSAGLPPALGERWRALAGQYPLERYGMTEIGIVLGNPLDGERRPGSCGKPLPGVEVTLVDDRGSAVAPGEAGELWVKAPTVFHGYDGDEEATRASFRDGWFRTGDTARLLSDGYVELLGRTSVDILKSGGYKVSAIEVENVLREHDAIADAAVVGLPDDLWGDRVVAAVIVHPDRRASIDPERVRDWAKERLAPYKVPKRVVLLEDLPRNALGKVTKSVLAETLQHLSEDDEPRRA